MRKIQSFSSTKIEVDEFESEAIVRGEDHYMFVIRAVRYVDNKKTLSYIFLKRKIAYVRELIDEGLNSEKKQLSRKQVLINEKQDV